MAPPWRASGAKGSVGLRLGFVEMVARGLLHPCRGHLMHRWLKAPRERSFAARPEARPLAAASPLSNPRTLALCESARIAQGLSESIGPKLGLS